MQAVHSEDKCPWTAYTLSIYLIIHSHGLMSLQKNFLTNKNTKLNIKVFKLDCKTSKIAGVKKNGYETIL